VAIEPSEIAQVLVRADTERGYGRRSDAARLYDRAAAMAGVVGDLDAWADAALGAASVQVFGAEPGRLPSLLYDVLARTTDFTIRSRLAAALARCWVYAGQAPRGAPFADQSVEYAQRTGNAALISDALDAALTAHWGPDEIDTRRILARGLDEAAAHVTDPDVRLQSHLWGLHVACEALDVQAMNRQMRALEHLGEESPRALFFAASRRLMLNLLRGKIDATRELISVATAAAAQSSIPDAQMVLKSMDGYSAVQERHMARIAGAARAAEDFARAEGAVAVCAEAAYWWVEAGQHAKARALAQSFHGSVLDDLPRDVNWLLTLQCVLEVALALEDNDLVEMAADLLTPYAGRAVVNAGAVMFHGTTDDTLSRACALLGQRTQAATLRKHALVTYERIGAQWWYQRLAERESSTTIHSQGERRPHLHPTLGGLWVIGDDGTAVAGLRGFGYLRELVRHPGHPVPALDLVGMGGAVVHESGLGEVADRQALEAYHRRLVELDAELDEATDWADPGRIDALRGEREALLDEVRRATGIGGRRRVVGSSGERARVAVKKAITTAIGRIADFDEPLAHHLRNSVHTGLICSYDPDPGVTVHWILTEHTQQPERIKHNI
jgi:hypothetical protein